MPPTPSYNLSSSTYNVFDLASLYLKTAGFPDTPLNRRLLGGWFWAESGHSGKNGVVVYNNNPLNITTTSANYHMFDKNNLHFANYATPQEGAAAWAAFLANVKKKNVHGVWVPRYFNITSALRSGTATPWVFASAVGSSGWGTSYQGVVNSVLYMQHFPADVVNQITGGGVNNTGKTLAAWLTDYMNQNHIASSSQVTAAQLSDFINNWLPARSPTLAGALQEGGPNDWWHQMTTNVLGNNVTWATITGADNNYTGTGTYQNGAPANNAFPDLTGITGFFGNLGKNNVLHAAAIPAGAFLVFFGARIILAGAGVSSNGVAVTQ